MSDHISVLAPALGRVETRVSSYDRLNAFVLAALVLLGSFAAILFMLWMNAKSRPMEATPDAVFIIGDPGEEKPEGIADDVLEPGVEEFPEVETPQLAEALLAVTSAVSSIQARDEHVSGTATQMGRGPGLGSRDGGGGGGDGMPGWEVNVEARDRGSYAKQLSFFKIQIAAVNELNNNVYRLADPGGSATLTQTSKGEEKSQKTVLFAHKNPRLKEWDNDLLRRAGRDPQGYVVGQIYPQDLINTIRGLEEAYTKQQGREMKEVRTTSFKIVESGNEYKFEVSGQTYKR